MNPVFSRWQKALLEQLIDQYENSKTYRGENQITQKFSVIPSRIWKEYYSDYADIHLVHDFECQMKELEQKGLIRISWKEHGIEKLTAVSESQDACYKILGRRERRKLEQEQIVLYEGFLGDHPMLNDFCRDQIERLREGKRAQFPMEDAEKILKLWRFLLENQKEILERELSIAVLGDSKLWEKKYCTKVCRLLKKYGDFEALLYGIDEEREAEKILLGEYHVTSNPSFVYFKGNARIQFQDGQVLDLCRNTPVAFTEKTLEQINGITILAPKVMTVENLTSFHRLEDEAFFYLFLSGYHNHLKQMLLCRIYERNQQAQWYHFGDLDPDGFFIIEHLIKGTGIPFRPIYMDTAYLRKYDAYTKPLKENDMRKARTLLQQGKYGEVMEYMLHEKKKLEQEIISWMERK